MTHTFDYNGRCSACGATEEDVQDGHVARECKGAPVNPISIREEMNRAWSPFATETRPRWTDQGCGYGCGSDQMGNLISRTDCTVHGTQAKAEPEFRHVSDAAWEAVVRNCSYAQREVWEQLYQRDGTVLLTVAEHDELRAEVERLRAEIERLRKVSDASNTSSAILAAAPEAENDSGRAVLRRAVAAMADPLDHRLGRGNGAMDE